MMDRDYDKIVLAARLKAAEPLLAMASLDAAERRAWEQEIFALKDGLRGWKETAAKAEQRAEKAEGNEQTVAEISALVAQFDPDICGTLVERVRQVIGRVRQVVA
jgi:hypothetical protein